MEVSAIGHYQKFKSVTEEHRKPPVEREQAVIVPHKHNKRNPVALTGWIGVASLLTAIATGFGRMNTLHKISAFTAFASIAGHIGLISAHHHSPHINQQA